ncbi:GNAT family N-acetyltransferase [Micromonospora olivasterospora]|uniref:Acetyltransferase (GNAT) family protein n=1 Tax=Micromonospora olivasterospora TaxID=1880 RepID=A0A562IIQ6_MICOL|nr:GNAT family N-acetyltransferase [Micromonospora olivasterospora]TWH70909.1 acetyltransferase (GNAT) family protein [Micromonospora olivasterospora]
MARLSRTAGLLGLRYPGGPELNEERHATWLELFFDLVFVLALLGVTARLDIRASPSVQELAVAIVLYVLIQWSWIGQSFYDTRYDPDDTLHQLLVLAATVGAGAITLGVQQAPSGLLLPVGYLIVRGCLLLMYLRVLAADRSAWDLVAVYLTGFGTDAARVLLRWAFDTLDLSRVQAETDTRNVASARVLEKLGFVREGKLREDCAELRAFWLLWRLPGPR